MRKVVQLQDFLPVHSTKQYSLRDVDRLACHVIHHTAVEGLTPERCARWHIDHNNWPGIAYTYWITSDGMIFQVNDLDVLSAGVANHNDIYLSTVLVGCFVKGKVPSDEQIATANWLHQIYIPSVLGRKLSLKGHRNCIGAATMCPGTWDVNVIDTYQPTAEEGKEIILSPDFTWRYRQRT